MTLYFVTQNPVKAKFFLSFFKGTPIHVTHNSMGYEEPDGLTLQETAALGAKTCCEKLHAPVFVDDTGFFFEGYNNFPGAAAKRTFQKLGFKGLFEKIKEKKVTHGYFLTVLGYCEPGKKPVLFEGKMRGTLITTVRLLLPAGETDHQPYSRFFIPEGYTKTLIELRAEGNEPHSHRLQALEKLLKYLKNKEDDER